MVMISFLKGREEGHMRYLESRYLAYAIPKTLHGDPILGLKRSGLGGQHSLPMQLEFG